MMNANQYEFMEPVYYFLIVVAIVVLILAVYLKNIFLWRKALHNDLSNHMKNRENRHPQARKAMGLVADKCRIVLSSRASSDDLSKEIPVWLRSIAGCFHPDSLNPELQATPSRIIRCLDSSMGLYDRILGRPGFSSVSRLSIKDIRRASSLVKSKNSSMNLKTPWHKALFHAIRNFRSLYLMKYLVADLLLYLGCLAVDIYDERSPAFVKGDSEIIEETLREISGLTPDEPVTYPEDILRIRNSLVGMPGILVKEPTPEALVFALVKTAETIAAGYFPQTHNPLWEAKIGPLTSRCRVFLSSIGKAGDYPMQGKVLSIRLATLLQAKSISQAFVPKKIRDILEKTLDTYGWLKWPLRVYLMTSQGVFWKFAADAGWFAGRKALLVVFFGRCFDKAVKEIDQVYRLSK
ncbi:MAG: hypothetical protein WC799_11705 [Desulfobacteraceae bacterium]|jgi:hypothetical protein